MNAENQGPGPYAGPTASPESQYKGPNGQGPQQPGFNQGHPYPPNGYANQPPWWNQQMPPGYGYPPPGYGYPGDMGGQGYGPGPAGFQNPQAGPPPSGKDSGMGAMLKTLANASGIPGLAGMLDLDDQDFWKGALVGAAVVLLLTNDNLRGTLVKGFAAATGQAGAESNDDEAAVDSDEVETEEES